MGQEKEESSKLNLRSFCQEGLGELRGKTELFIEATTKEPEKKEGYRGVAGRGKGGVPKSGKKRSFKATEKRIRRCGEGPGPGGERGVFWDPMGSSSRGTPPEPTWKPQGREKDRLINPDLL